MYDNVIIGVAGDDDDRRAVALAQRLAAEDAQITLVHVSVVSPFGAGEKEGLELQLNETGEARRSFVDQLSLSAFDTRMLREHAPSVGAGLQAAAERVGADLLVLGSTRHRGLDRVLTGDDVSGALSRTRCAIAVADADQHAAAVRTIGLAYDGTPESVVAAEHAQALAAALGAKLVPFYVAAPHVYATGFGMVAYPVEDPESVIAAAQAHLGSVGEAPVKVIYGDPLYELVQFSQSVDLLVCGSRRQAAVRRFVFGSTSVSLSRNARCPLLVAPAGEPTEATAQAPAATVAAHD